MDPLSLRRSSSATTGSRPACPTISPKRRAPLRRPEIACEAGLPAQAVGLGRTRTHETAGSLETAGGSGLSIEDWFYTPGGMGGGVPTALNKQLLATGNMMTR